MKFLSGKLAMAISGTALLAACTPGNGDAPETDETAAEAGGAMADETAPAEGEGAAETDTGGDDGGQGKDPGAGGVGGN